MSGATPAAPRAGRPLMRRVAALAAGVIAVAAAAWWGTRPARPAARRAGPVVLAIAPFRTAGTGLDPWSGLGLAAQVRGALDTAAGISARLADGGAPAAADYLVGGTLARQGSRSTIAIEIVRGRDRALLWTGTFWRGPGELWSLSDELAQQLAIVVRQDAPNPRDR